ncbi:CBS domain-containing protein [Methanosarcinales archaeon]|nr:MAG: CBS domain-containing protein [Methanosarcinales archaeon]
MKTDVKVENIMSAPVYVISSKESLSRARNLMLRYKVGRLVVVEDDVAVGVITRTDIAKALLQPEPMWRRRPVDNMLVKHAMSKRFIKVHPKTTIEEATILMVENNISGVPVLDGSNILGIVTLTDIVKYVSTLDIPVLVRDVMEDFVPTVNRHQSISRVVEKFETEGIDRVVVLEDNGHSVGIITKSNVALAELNELLKDISQGKEIKMVRKNSYGGQKKYRYIKETSLTAEDIMRESLITVRDNEKVSEAAKLMIQERIRGLPVVNEKDELCGLLTEENVASTLLRRGEND